jgi:NADP-dependent 3-hydroxy acid dehydrogenase YdfG
LGSARKLFEVASAEAAELVNINILGTLNVLRVVVPKFLRQNHGHVIILGSIVGQYAGTGPALYGATKSAVHVMARDLRSDLFGSAIRVTEILPGRVKTGIHRQLTGTDDTGDREFYDGYACLEPDDVAASILWAVQAPAHVDVTQVEILPTHQVPGGARFWKQEG